MSELGYERGAMTRVEVQCSFPEMESHIRLTGFDNETKIDFRWSVEPLEMEMSFQLVTKFQQGLDFGPWCLWYQDGLEGQFFVRNTVCSNIAKRRRSVVFVVSIRNIFFWSDVLSCICTLGGPLQHLPRTRKELWNGCKFGVPNGNCWHGTGCGREVAGHHCLHTTDDIGRI